MNLTTLQTIYVVLPACMMLAALVLVIRAPAKVEMPIVLAVLRYGIALRTLALVLALAPPLVTIYVVWALSWRNPAALHLAGIAFLMASVPGLLLLIEVARVQIVVTDDSLTRFSPWSGVLTLRWIDVERVAHSALNRWFVVSGAGQSVRVSRFLGDLPIFVETVRRKVASERCTGAAAALNAVIAI